MKTEANLKNHPLGIRGLPLLDLLIENGRCMDYEGDMTPSIPSRHSSRAEREELIAKRTAALNLCKACNVQFDCAVYSLANEAHPVHGASVLSEERKKAAEDIAYDKTGFEVFVELRTGLRQ